MVTAKKWIAQLTEPGPRIIAGVNVLVLLGLTYSLAAATWRMMPPPEALPAPQAATQPTTSATAAPQAAVPAGRQLAGMHLFGELKVEVEEAPKPVDLPVTQLKLTLKGLMASTVPEEARAIVADPSGKESFYKIGDKLPGNAELSEIHSDRIVLKRGTRFETLKLPKDELSPTEFKRSAGAPSVADTPSSQTSLRQYRDALLNDPASVGDIVQFKPHSSGGYELQPGRDRQFLARSGLRPGDVVKSVDGIELDNPAKGLRLLRDLKGKDKIHLEIERDGIRQTFDLPLN